MAWHGDGQQEELLWSAVSDAVKEVAHLETEYSSDKLAKKLRDYFRKGAKSLEFGQKPLQVLVNEYADSVFGIMFNALGNRPWLEQADFLLCLDAAIKDTFPQELVGCVSRQEFESTVLAAHDRAFEEQRFLPILWETVRAIVPGQKSRKNIYNAGELGRKTAASMADPAAENEVEHFVGNWVDATVDEIAKSSGGDPDWLLPLDQAVELFRGLVSGGGLPVALRETHGPPPPEWPFVESAVRTSYAARVAGQAWSGGGKKRKVQNRGSSGIKQPSVFNAFSIGQEEYGSEGDAFVAWGEEGDAADGGGLFDPEAEPAEPPAKRFQGLW